MPTCPVCKKSVDKMEKTWKYGQFDVRAYKCACNTGFREYFAGKERKFTLANVKGKGQYKKVK